MRLGIFCTRDEWDRAKSVNVDEVRTLALDGNELFMVRKSDLLKRVEALSDANLGLILVLRPNDDKLPPRDYGDWGDQVEKACETLRPRVLVVGNEWDDQRLYWRGTAEQALRTVEVAAKRVKSLRLPVVVTDSGFTSNGIQSAIANDGSYRGNFIRYFFGMGRGDPKRLRDAGVECVNFHFYQKTGKLKTHIANVKRISGLKRIMTSELGQWNEDPQEVKDKLQICLEAGVERVTWFDNDNTERAEDGSEYAARGLRNPDGTLRPNGVAFRDFAQQLNLRGPE